MITTVATPTATEATTASSSSDLIRLHLLDGRTTTEGTCELNTDNPNYIHLTNIHANSTIRELKEACARELNDQAFNFNEPLTNSSTQSADCSPECPSSESADSGARLSAQQLRLIYLTNKSSPSTSISSTCRPLTDLVIDDRTLLDYEIANESWLMVKLKFIPSSHPVAPVEMGTDENEEEEATEEEGEEEWVDEQFGEDTAPECVSGESEIVTSVGEDSIGPSSSFWTPSNVTRPETNDIDRHSFSHCLTFLPSHERCLLSRVCHAFQIAVMDRLSGWSTDWIHFTTPSQFSSFPSYYHPLVTRLSLGQKQTNPNWDEGWCEIPQDAFRLFSRVTEMNIGELDLQIPALEHFFMSPHLRLESLAMDFVCPDKFPPFSHSIRVPIGLHHLKKIHLEDRHHDLFHVASLIQACSGSLESLVLPGHNDYDGLLEFQTALSQCKSVTSLTMPSRLLNEWLPPTPLHSLQHFHEVVLCLPTRNLFIVAPQLTSLTCSLSSDYVSSSIMSGGRPDITIRAIGDCTNLHHFSFDLHVTLSDQPRNDLNVTFEYFPFQWLVDGNASHLCLVESNLRVVGRQAEYSARWEREGTAAATATHLQQKESTKTTAPENHPSSAAASGATSFLGVPCPLLCELHRLEVEQIKLLTPSDVTALSQLQPTITYLSIPLISSESWAVDQLWAALSKQINLESLVIRSPRALHHQMDGSELNRLLLLASKFIHLHHVVLDESFHLYQPSLTQFLQRLPDLNTIHITLHPDQSLSTVGQLLTDLCQPYSTSASADPGVSSTLSVATAAGGHHRTFHSLRLTLGRSLSSRDRADLDQIQELVNRYRLLSCLIN